MTRSRWIDGLFISLTSSNIYYVNLSGSISKTSLKNMSTLVLKHGWLENPRTEWRFYGPFSQWVVVPGHARHGPRSLPPRCAPDGDGARAGAGGARRFAKAAGGQDQGSISMGYYAGWWFGTFFYMFHILGIFQRGWKHQEVWVIGLSLEDNDRISNHSRLQLLVGSYRLNSEDLIGLIGSLMIISYRRLIGWDDRWWYRIGSNYDLIYSTWTSDASVISLLQPTKGKWMTNDSQPMAHQQSPSYTCEMTLICAVSFFQWWTF